MPGLEQLSDLARAAERRGDVAEELRLWRQALDLAPAQSEEYQIIDARVQQLSRRVDKEETPAQAPANWVKKLGPLGAALLLLWKFKAILLVALSKGKLLLFGLGKFSTFSSMLLSMAAYWGLYGWRFALGIVTSIYVHEMGHVWALRRFGIAASAPMFIPFIGAFVRLHQRPANPIEDARVGLAGPIWGTAFAIAAFLAYVVTGQQAIGAIAHFAAWINLFNLLPVWQLDGARGFAALSRMQRIGVVAVMTTAAFLSGEGFLYILAVCGAIRAYKSDAPAEGDSKTLMQFCGLLVVLALLMAVPINRVAGR